MKRIDTKWLVVLLSLPFMISCNWEDLPTYEEAEISAAQFYYRWVSDAKDPITHEPIVKEQRLTVSSKANSEAGILEVSVTVPEANGEFTETVRSQVSQSKLWGQVTVSTAARITPLAGSNQLGTADDWTREHKFEVKAANGKTKVWTIKVTEFKK